MFFRLFSILRPWRMAEGQEGREAGSVPGCLSALLPSCPSRDQLRRSTRRLQLLSRLAAELVSADGQRLAHFPARQHFHRAVRTRNEATLAHEIWRHDHSGFELR